MPSEIVERARALIGCRFRPQGRDPELGLDCVGLVCVACAIPAVAVPCDYRLRGRRIERLEAELARLFRRVVIAEAGDVLLLEVSPDQLHLAILTERGFIHADAGLRRVVETPGAPAWTLISAYRRRTS